MATQSTNNDKTDISGELLPSYLEVSGFCGSLTGYLKGSINGWKCNGEFTSYRLNNDDESHLKTRIVSNKFQNSSSPLMFYLPNTFCKWFQKFVLIGYYACNFEHR